MSVREHKHQTRDVAVRLLRDGSGPPLLFLHGAAGLPVWSPFFAELAKNYDVLVPEHPGFGNSDNPAWVRNVGDVAMYYLDVLDDLKLGKVHVIGHSLGGWIAAEAAVRNCEHFASLGLIAPAGVRVKGILSGDNFIWTPEETARNLFHDQSFAERMIALTPTEEEADLVLANRFMAAKLGWEPRWFNPALERWLHRIKAPTQVLWGEDDKIMPCAYSKVWAERVPDVRVRTIPRCGHLPHVEQASVAAETFLGFLAGQ